MNKLWQDFGLETRPSRLMVHGSGIDQLLDLKRWLRENLSEAGYSWPGYILWDHDLDAWSAELMVPDPDLRAWVLLSWG